MLRKFIAYLRETRHREEGLGITEVIVTVAIIIVATLGTGLALGNTFEAQALTESRNRAVAIAQDRIAQAQLVSYKEIGFPLALLNQDQVSGGLGGAVEYNGEKIKTINIDETAFKVLPYEEVVVGKTDLSVSTYVTVVRPNTFDGTVETFAVSDLAPRRITVVVKWETARGTQSVVRSIVKYPNPNECAPNYTVKNTTNMPEGCVNV